MDSGNDLPGNPPARPRYQRYWARLWIGLACSLAVHGLILSLQFGIPGLGLPGLALPWTERRALAPELNVTLAGVKQAEEMAGPAPGAAPPQAPSVTAGTLQAVPLPPGHAPSATAAHPRIRKPTAPPKPRPAVRRKPAPPVVARTDPADDTFRMPVPEPTEQAGELNAEAQAVAGKDTPAPPSPEPASEDKPAKDDSAEQAARLAQLEAQQREEARKLDEAREVEEARKQQAKQAEEARKAEDARKLAEARKLEEVRQADEARKQQETLALRRAAEAEAKKREEQEAARRAIAARQEELRSQEQALAERKAAELEARRRAEEMERQQAAELERQKRAEQLAAKAKADEAARVQAEQEARRQQEEQLAAARQAELAERQRAAAAAARQGELDRAAAQEAQARVAAAAAAAARNAVSGGPAGAAPGGDLASRALSQARNLDLSRREQSPPALAPPLPAVPGSPDRPVRRSVFGKVDNDIGLSMYIEGWRLKIERNGRLNYSQSARDRARGDPIVTVAIRSDGSVEDIVIHRSSGRPELDEAVRRIVRLNARYAAFPAALARRYDVIEIRRIWSFEDSLRILEELETR